MISCGRASPRSCAHAMNGRSDLPVLDGAIRVRPFALPLAEPQHMPIEPVRIACVAHGGLGARLAFPGHGSGQRGVPLRV